MELWNLIAFILIVAALVQAYLNGWAMPKFASWTTIAATYLIGSLLLKLANGMA